MIILGAVISAAQDLTPSFWMSVLGVVVGVTGSFAVTQTQVKQLQAEVAALKAQTVTKEVLEAHLAALTAQINAVVSGFSRLEGRIDSLIK